VSVCAECRPPIRALTEAGFGGPSRSDKSCAWEQMKRIPDWALVWCASSGRHEQALSDQIQLLVIDVLGLSEERLEPVVEWPSGLWDG